MCLRGLYLDAQTCSMIGDAMLHLTPMVLDTEEVTEMFGGLWHGGLSAPNPHAFDTDRPFVSPALKSMDCAILQHVPTNETASQAIRQTVRTVYCCHSHPSVVLACAKHLHRAKQGAERIFCCHARGSKVDAGNRAAASVLERGLIVIFDI